MYGEKISLWERFMLRFQPTPQQVVEAELRQAKLAALESQSKAEYAALRVQIYDITTTYHSNRIERLQAFTGEK